MFTEGITDFTSLGGLTQYAQNVLNGLVLITGPLALAAVVYGGVMYMLSAGDEKKAQTAKQIIMYALIGVVLIVGSYFLITLVSNFFSQAPSNVTVAEDPEPAGEPEITYVEEAAADPALEAKINSLKDSSAQAETTNLQASSKLPWKQTSSLTTYNNAKYWKGASTTPRSSCTLGTVMTVDKKALQVGQHHITFKSTGQSNVNYFVLIPDYQINLGSPRYTTLEEHIPSFAEKDNIRDYTFNPDSKSNAQGYTSYVARLSGYYLYKQKVVNFGVTSYNLYKITCGAKKITDINAPKKVDGVALKDKAVIEIGNKENPKTPNCGSQIKKYKDCVGLTACGDDGQWCAAFVSWVWTNTNVGLPSSRKPQIKEIGAMQMKDRLNTSTELKRYQTLKNTSSVSNNFTAGDILIRSKSWTDGHVGMVKSYDGKNLVTIEGNIDDKVISRTFSGNTAIKNYWDYYGHWLKY